MPMPDSNHTIKAALMTAYKKYPNLSSGTVQAILCHIIGRERSWILAHGEESLSLPQFEQFSESVDRVGGGEPLAYLTGKQAFSDYNFIVSPDVLIPRPETEDLVYGVIDWAKHQERDQLRIVDVGTGSGVIAVTLALKLPQATITGIDVSSAALIIAQKNADLHHVADRIDLLEGDLLDGLEIQWDCIVANLPYIADDVMPTLDVTRWEPAQALDGGADGLVLLRRLIKQAKTRLVSGGLLALEIGYDQGEAVAALCRESFPNADVQVHRDLTRLDRRVEVIT